MRGKFLMNSTELEYWKTYLTPRLEKILSQEDEEIDLTDEDISPCMVDTVLEKLGWERNDFEISGWEGDTWMWYVKDDQYLTVFYCGYTFDLRIYETERDETYA